MSLESDGVVVISSETSDKPNKINLSNLELVNKTTNKINKKGVVLFNLAKGIKVTSGKTDKKYISEFVRKGIPFAFC